MTSSLYNSLELKLSSAINNSIGAPEHSRALHFAPFTSANQTTNSSVTRAIYSYNRCQIAAKHFCPNTAIPWRPKRPHTAYTAHAPVSATNTKSQSLKPTRNTKPNRTHAHTHTSSSTTAAQTVRSELLLKNKRSRLKSTRSPAKKETLTIFPHRPLPSSTPHSLAPHPPSLVPQQHPSLLPGRIARRHPPHLLHARRSGRQRQRQRRAQAVLRILRHALERVAGARQRAGRGVDGRYAGEFVGGESELVGEVGVDG